MSTGEYARKLFNIITEYNLDARHPELADIKWQIEHGMLADEVARDYLLMIDPLVQHAIDYPNILHRAPSREELYADGPPDIELGELAEAPDVRFGLRVRDRPRSVLIAGAQGAGKTVALLNIIIKLYQLGQRDPAHRVCLIVIDRKGDFVHLPSQLGSDWVRLNYHDPGTRISLAAPEGVPPNAWINLIASIFAARSGMVAAWTCFANILRWLLAQLNPTPGPALRWPSLSLVLQVALAKDLTLWAAKPDYGKTLIGVLEAITQSTRVFECFAGLDIERDIVRPGKHLLLEMPLVEPSWVRQFIIDLILAQILFGRMHRHQKTDRAEVCLCLDEMDTDATAEADRHFPDQMSPLAHTLRLGREFGIMAVIGMGRMRHASPYVLSEPRYHLIFNQSDSDSVVAARSTLILPRQADAMFPSLQPGTCIAREAQGPWPHPMLVKIDYQPPGRGPTSTAYGTHPVVPSVHLSELPEVKQALNTLAAAKLREKRDQKKATADTLSEHAHRLLNTAAVNPWAPAATLWKLSGKIPDARTQKAVRKDLDDADLCESEEVRLGRANVLLYSITPAGWEFLRCDPPRRPGGGSIAHQHISHWIALCGEIDGHKATCEQAVPGTAHRVDCAWEIESGLFSVFEVIVTSTGNILQHLSALNGCAAVRRITIVCQQKRYIADLQKAFTDEPIVGLLGDRLAWELAETYLRRCFP